MGKIFTVKNNYAYTCPRENIKKNYFIAQTSLINTKFKLKTGWQFLVLNIIQLKICSDKKHKHIEKNRVGVYFYILQVYVL